MNEIDAIRARLAAATPGPWESGTLDGHAADVFTVAADDAGRLVICEHAGIDAEMIANAPTDIARLLAAVDAVEKLAAAWEARGKHSIAYSAEVPEEIQESLLDSGAEMIDNARKIRAALTAALTPTPDVTGGAGAANGAGVGYADEPRICDPQNGAQR